MNSDEPASAEHSWTNPGTYNLTVRAVDEWDKKSEWSDVRNVTIERTDPTRLDLETVKMIVVLIVVGILIVAGLLFIVFPTKAKDVVIELGIPMKGTGKYSGGIGPILIAMGVLVMLLWARLIQNPM